MPVSAKLVDVQIQQLQIMILATECPAKLLMALNSNVWDIYERLLYQLSRQYSTISLNVVRKRYYYVNENYLSCYRRIHDKTTNSSLLLSLHT